MPETVKPDEKAEEGAPAPPQHRNIVLTGFGGLKMLKVQRRASNAPGPGEVSIRVKACGLNFVDLMVRQGVLDSPPKTPLVMGFECAGEVGDHVMAFTDYGAWGEVVVAPASLVFKMPSNMSYAEGAALPMNYLTAQLCRTVEDVTLYGTASAHKHEVVKANLTSVIDRSADYLHEIRKLSPEGVDIVLDCMCGEDTNKGISLLKPMGKYVLYGSSNIVTGETKSFFSFAKSWWQVDKVSPIKLYDENKTISGLQLRHLAFQQGQTAYIRSAMNRLLQLYTQGKIKPVVDSTWAFEDTQQSTDEAAPQEATAENKPEAEENKDASAVNGQ
ncbi:VAT1L-like protein [Mya arenaria]|uniref:VAT1L-like protein n=1 Tax=Mya arenaria TaxID=6604 RepID=A0ABY7ET98_MYAAR|nr:VAT1L-like protein [Mya arenaria]